MATKRSSLTGLQLRGLRVKLLKLSQAELAEKLGISANTAARYERGELKIPMTIARHAGSLLRIHQYEEAIRQRVEGEADGRRLPRRLPFSSGKRKHSWT
jgi:transcriptional regulator with XRE-family HTH domain